MAAGKTPQQLAEEMSRFELEISGVGPPSSSTMPMVPGGNPGLATQAAAALGVHIPRPGNPPAIGTLPPPGMSLPGVFPGVALTPHMVPVMPMAGAAPGVPLVPPMPGMVPVPVVLPPVQTDSATSAATSAASSAVAAQVKEEQQWASQFSQQQQQQKTLSKQEKKKRLRTAAGAVWEDATMDEWDPNDFRLFCGDLGHEVSDEVLRRAFARYPSLIRGKVVRDKRTGKSRGYGFVSFKDPKDYMAAMREMNGKYIGSRPVKLRKSTWKDRQLDVSRKKQKEKEKLGLK